MSYTKWQRERNEPRALWFVENTKIISGFKEEAKKWEKERKEVDDRNFQWMEITENESIIGAGFAAPTYKYGDRVPNFFDRREKSLYTSKVLYESTFEKGGGSTLIKIFKVEVFFLKEENLQEMEKRYKENKLKDEEKYSEYYKLEPGEVPTEWKWLDD